MQLIIGTAGWSIPIRDADRFPQAGSSLERFARLFRGVEINSSFHRPHRTSTWARWAESVPADFRFSVKMPKTITHQARLAGCDDLVSSFLDDVKPLGAKLAVLLVQLPPKLAFDPEVAAPFFARLLDLTSAAVVCEPRHPSWFTAEAEVLLETLRVARAAADPSLSSVAAEPGGWRGLAYWRLHGSPVMYRSAYTEEALDAYAHAVAAALEEGRTVWCMFDNTAGSEATGNALSLLARLGAGSSPLASGVDLNDSSELQG